MDWTLLVHFLRSSSAISRKWRWNNSGVRYSMSALSPTFHSITPHQLGRDAESWVNRLGTGPQTDWPQRNCGRSWLAGHGRLAARPPCCPSLISDRTCARGCLGYQDSPIRSQTKTPSTDISNTAISAPQLPRYGSKGICALASLLLYLLLIVVGMSKVPWRLKNLKINCVSAICAYISGV